MTTTRPDVPREPRPGRPTAALVAAGLLLAVPVVGLLWVSSYAKASPRLLGFPFFYWYQFLWVLIASACTSVAFRLVAGGRASRRASAGTDEGRAR